MAAADQINAANARIDASEPKPWELKMSAEILVGQTVMVLPEDATLNSLRSWMPAVVLEVRCETKSESNSHWEYVFLVQYADRTHSKIRIRDAENRIRQHPQAKNI